MTPLKPDSVFAGSIPELYERLLAPMIFEPYAGDLADRVAALNPLQVLEIAAGTGVATRAMARALPARARLVATDLNQPMLQRAEAAGTVRPVEWQQVDAMHLPFGESTFDAVVCQFGVMFFPDRKQALSEARRVLRPGGAFLFNVWDRIEENEFAETVNEALAGLYPSDPPRFIVRTPHGYHHPALIDRDLSAAGFRAGTVLATVAARSRAKSPAVPAVAFCQGTPLRFEIEARSTTGLEEATEVCTAALSRRFGPGAVDGKIQAHVVTARA